MAKEYGWTHHYIVKSLTYSQIMQYGETAVKLKNREYYRMAHIILNASATANGNMKVDEFRKSIEVYSDVKKEINSNKSVDEMKQDGLPIEDN